MDPLIPNSQATFNQAQFQMVRLHRLMEQVNLCWSNLTEKTEGLPNHQILFDCLSAYYLEVRPKFTDKERLSVDKQLEATEKIISSVSIEQTTSVQGLTGTSTQKTINIKGYFLIREVLRLFQSRLFELSDSHSLLNPNKSDPNLAVTKH